LLCERKIIERAANQFGINSLISFLIYTNYSINRKKNRDTDKNKNETASKVVIPSKVKESMDCFFVPQCNNAITTF